MAYNEDLYNVLQIAIAKFDGVSEKHMFGGVAFMVFGNMCVGVCNNDLMVRLDKEEGTKLLKEPGARPMDFTGRPLKGWLFINKTGYSKSADLEKWIKRAYNFASALPKK